MREIIGFELDRRESMIRHTQLYRMKVYEPIEICGKHLSAGDTGGLVECPSNIINSWVENGAIVCGNATVKDCIVRHSCYIDENAYINGNGCYIGGNAGDVVINGDIILNLQCPIDMGPLTLTGKGELNGSNDILSISGLFNNKGYGTHLTAYKSSSDIFCYSSEIGLCKLSELKERLMVDTSIFNNTDDTYVKSLTRNLAIMIKSYFA